MISRTSTQSVNDEVRDTVQTASHPVVLGYGVNWVSFVASHPFEVTGMTSLFISDAGDEDAVLKDCDALVQSQLPVASVITSNFALKKAFTSSIVHPSAGSEMRREVQHIGTVWCLPPSSVYMATLSSSAEEDGNTSTSTTELAVHTSSWSSSLDLRAVSAHVLDPGSLLFHPEFTRCILSQGAEEFMVYLPPDLLDPSTAIPFLHRLWYSGLFSLPQSLCVEERGRAMFFQLPNGNTRYTLDLAPESTTEPLCSSASQLITAALTTSAGRDAPAPSYSWRRGKKVRRIIRSSAYAVVVHDDPGGIEESLRRACSYHQRSNGSTWLNEDFIRLMGQCAGGSVTSSTDDSDSYASENIHQVRLLSIELVKKATGEVMAGSCGIAIGCTYHDYTMYTLQRSQEGLGTFLTKLIGEALQRCGYTMWYWGFCLDYMRQYERCLGAVDMPRDVFYRRWCTARDAVPECTVDVYLRSHRAMVPYYESPRTPANTES